MTEAAAVLSEQELESLDDFLTARFGDGPLEDDPNRDDGVLCLSALDGFFAAVASSPKTLEPVDWLAVIWGDTQPQWQSPAQMERLIDLLSRFLEDIDERLTQEPDDFEPVWFYEPEDTQLKQPIVDEWCDGYVRGVALWPRGAAASLEPELQAQLQAITMHGTDEGWEQVERLETENPEELQRIRASIPDACRALHAAGWYARAAVAQQRREAAGLSVPVSVTEVSMADSSDNQNNHRKPSASKAGPTAWEIAQARSQKNRSKRH